LFLTFTVGKFNLIVYSFPRPLNGSCAPCFQKKYKYWTLCLLCQYMMLNVFPIVCDFPQWYMFALFGNIVFGHSIWACKIINVLYAWQLQIPHLRPTEYKRSWFPRNRRRTVNRAYGEVLSGGALLGKGLYIGSFGLFWLKSKR
jgi:hypothetical protein